MRKSERRYLLSYVGQCSIHNSRPCEVNSEYAYVLGDTKYRKKAWRAARRRAKQIAIESYEDAL